MQLVGSRTLIILPYSSYCEVYSNNAEDSEFVIFSTLLYV